MLLKSSFSLLPSLFVLFFLAPSSLSQEDGSAALCAPRDCGKIPAGNISYPFWFDGQPAYCGDPNFKLYCNEDFAEIEILSKRYAVEGIHLGRHALTLVDKDLAGDPCATLSFNTIIDLSLFNYSDQDLNLTLYNECPNPIPLDNRSYFPSPCASNGDDTYAYFTTHPPGNASFASCKPGVITLLKSMVDVLLRADTPRDEDNVRRLFKEVVQRGFEVIWTIHTGGCGDCEETDGRCGYNPENPQQHACLCGNQLRQDNCSGRVIELGGSSNNNNRTVIAVSSSVAGAVIFLICSFLIFIFREGIHKAIFFWNKEHKDDRDVEKFLKNYGSVVPKRYHYSDLKKMTSSFKDKLGQGGFGGVFKGKLQDGRLVAVKVLSNSKCNGEDFVNEVASIGRTNHVNIVTLLGFCSNRSKRALIYEFMHNGSLEKFIYGKARETNPLGWKKLYEIAKGIARGLDYLHRGCCTRIVHLDIKPHNILLDKDFQPKISDFGLAKICPPKESIISMMGARGTVGYIAPEVFCRNFGGVSHKSDVYSYGMMVLEMVGGRSNIEATAEKTSEIYFPDWIYKRVELNEHLELHGITTREEEDIARKMIIVALWCIQVDPADRPTTGRVVEMLEGSIEGLPVPPRPFLSSLSRARQLHSPVSTS